MTNDQVAVYVDSDPLGDETSRRNLLQALQHLSPGLGSVAPHCPGKGLAVGGCSGGGHGGEVGGQGVSGEGYDPPEQTS